MLDKTIIVFYVNIGNLDNADVSAYIEKVNNAIKPSEEDKKHVIHYVIPVRNQDTKVECLNIPKILTTEKEKYKFRLKLDNIDNKLDRITSYINASAEKRNVIIEKK